MIVARVVDIFLVHNDDAPILFTNTTANQRKLLRDAASIHVHGETRRTILCTYCAKHTLRCRTDLLNLLTRVRILNGADVCGTYAHVMTDVHAMIEEGIVGVEKGECGERILFLRPRRSAVWGEGDGCTACAHTRLALGRVVQTRTLSHTPRPPFSRTSN